MMDDRNYQSCLYIYPLQNQLAMAVFMVKEKKNGFHDNKKGNGDALFISIEPTIKSIKISSQPSYTALPEAKCWSRK